MATKESEHKALQKMQKAMQALFVVDAAKVELERPAFNVFDDMLAFPQVKVR